MSRIKISVLVAILVTVLCLGGTFGVNGIWGFQLSLAQAGDEYEHLRVGLPRMITSMDPLGYPKLNRTDLNVHMCVFDHLFRRAEDGNIVGHLAKDYKWLNDTTMRIHLRKGVTFHNGDKFTAADVKWTIEDMLDPARGPGLAGFMKGVEKVEVVDEHTVDIHTKGAFPTLPARLTCYTPMVSGKRRSTVDPKVYEKNPIGTGPFRFIEWKKGDRIVFERYEKYWKGVPKIKKLTFFPLADHTTRISALKSGSIDIALDVPPSLAKGLEKSPNLEVTAVPSVRVEWILLRTDQPPFNNKKVRQAVNYAINKEEYIATMLEGYGQT
jgi:peptide/nickel transport system substrate-binding protein